jgi:hypothetical protein
MQKHGSRLLLLTSLVLATASRGDAADQYARGRLEVSGSLGYANFPDEGPLHHFTAGMSSRFYLAQWLAVEPELTLMVRDSTDRDLVFIPNVVWDMSRRKGRVRPYLIGGVGTLTHWESNPWWTYRSTAWTLQAGGGAQIFLGRHLSVAPEARIGWPPVFRVGARVAWSFD